MQYSNPQLPEGVNVSATHPLLDFLRLLGGLLVVAAVLVGIAVLLADKLARYVPFSAEQAMASRFPVETSSGPVGEYLQALAGRVAAAQDLPNGMTVRVHYVDEPTVNAFATLGGNIVVFRGLIAKMPSENALAMVIAHEIAHVKLRHPITTLGRGLAIGAAISMVSAGTGSDIAGRTLGHAGLLTVLTFSRAQESAADADALRALAGVYGHVAHADELFRVLEREAARMPLDPPTFLRTHPLDGQRIGDISAAAQANGWGMEGKVQPLPEALLEAVRDPRD